MPTKNTRSRLIDKVKKRATKPSTVSYIVDKDTGDVIVATKRDNYTLDEHTTSVTDPPVAKGTDLSAPLVYKDGVIRNKTKADGIASDEILRDRKLAKASKNAQKFMEETNDTGISASVLIEVLQEQMLNLENGTPIDSFEEMMIAYETRVDNWEEITPKIRMC